MCWNTTPLMIVPLEQRSILVYGSLRKQQAITALATFPKDSAEFVTIQDGRRQTSEQSRRRHEKKCSTCTICTHPEMLLLIHSFIYLINIPHINVCPKVVNKILRQNKITIKVDFRKLISSSTCKQRRNQNGLTLKVEEFSNWEWRGSYD